MLFCSFYYYPYITPQIIFKDYNFSEFSYDSKVKIKTTKWSDETGESLFSPVFETSENTIFTRLNHQNKDILEN